MSDFLRSYVTVGLAGVVAVVLAAGTLWAGRLLRPDRLEESENDRRGPYESGAKPTSEGWSQSHVRYYLYGLLFMVFDVEVAFIVPWAVQVAGLGVFGLIEMAMFVAILGLGLAYAWRKDVLQWD